MLFQTLLCFHVTHLPDKVINNNCYQVNVFCGLANSRNPEGMSVTEQAMNSSEPQNHDPPYLKFTLEDAACKKRTKTHLHNTLACCQVIHCS